VVLDAGEAAAVLGGGLDDGFALGWAQHEQGRSTRCATPASSNPSSGLHWRQPAFTVGASEGTLSEDLLE
jgi:hypothetical protein